MGEPTDGAETEVRRLSAEDRPAYLAFARIAFGDGSHQADPDRIEWLYHDSPCATGLADALVGVRSDGAVIGCNHFMRLRWRRGDQRTVWAASHNLYVLPEHRHGIGASLIVAGLRGAGQVLLCGAAEAVRPLYERLGAQLLRCHWLQRPLTAPRAIARMARRTPSAQVLEALPDVEQTVRDLQVRSTSRPSAEDVAAALAVPAADGWVVDWDEALFRWRFFHLRGPGHRLVTLRRAGSPVGRATLTTSYRGRLPVGRVVDAVSEPGAAAELAIACERELLSLGAAYGLVVVSDGQLADAFQRRRWRPRAAPPGCYVATRHGEADVPAQVCGSAWDWGFETGHP